MIHGQGHEVLFAATSVHLPSHPIKDGRATDSFLLGLIQVWRIDGLLDDWLPLASHSYT